jgi:hypothetical protein
VSYYHYCDVAGHRWQCNGRASGPCECFCGLPMEEGDHSECPIQLLACPKHPQSEPGQIVEAEYNTEKLTPIQFPPDTAAKLKRSLKQAARCGAVCLWCGHAYREYSLQMEDEHFAYHCPNAPEKAKQDAVSRLKARHRKRTLCRNSTRKPK